MSAPPLAARELDGSLPRPDHERWLAVPAPFDLTRTARVAAGGHDPCVRSAPGVVWRTTRTAEGPATLLLRDGGQVATAGAAPHPVTVVGGQAEGTVHLVRAEAWGPGARAVLAAAEGLLGAHDRVDDFDPAPHPVVARAAHRRAGWRMGATGALVEAIVPVVLGQRVTVGEAVGAYRGMVERYGGPAPGAGGVLGLRLPPDPARLARLGYAELQRFGVERGRAETIIGLCRRAPSVERWAARPAADAAVALASLPGIGPWTISTVRQAVWGDADAAVVGDLHLPRVVGEALGDTGRWSDERMLELLAPFPGHRGRVQRLVVQVPPAVAAPRRWAPPPSRRGA